MVGRDQVAEPNLLAPLRGDRVAVVSGAATFADGGVEVYDLFAAVGDDQPVDRCQGLGAFDLTRVEHDLPTPEEGVEDLARPRAGPHPQADLRVLGIGETVHSVHVEDRGGVRPTGG